MKRIQEIGKQYVSDDETSTSVNRTNIELVEKHILTRFKKEKTRLVSPYLGGVTDFVFDNVSPNEIQH